MLKQILLMCALALAAFQVTATYIKQNGVFDHPLTEKDVRSLLDDVKKLLHELEDTVEGAINTAIGKLQGYIDEIKGFVEDAVTAGEAKIQEAIDAILGELDDIKHEAEQAGIDISDCLGENEEAIKNIPSNLLDGLVSCVTDKINEAVGLVTDVIDKVKSTINDVKDLANELDDCGSGLSSVICIGKVSAKITAAIVELPVQITKDVAEAALLVTNLKSDLEACATIQALEATKEGAEIIVVITECVKNKSIDKLMLK